MFLFNPSLMYLDICLQGLQANGKLVFCKLFNTANEDNKALEKYNIFKETWPLAEDHMCAPSGFNKIVAQCRKKHYGLV